MKFKHSHCPYALPYRKSRKGFFCLESLDSKERNCPEIGASHVFYLGSVLRVYIYIVVFEMYKLKAACLYRLTDPYEFMADFKGDRISFERCL